MFLWGIDYLHFQSDKNACVGGFDVTCSKPSSDYKVEDTVDLGPCTAPPWWAPSSYADTQEMVFHVSKSSCCTLWKAAMPQMFSKDFLCLARAWSMELLLCHEYEPWGMSQASAHEGVVQSPSRIGCSAWGKESYRETLLHPFSS